MRALRYNGGKTPMNFIPLDWLRWFARAMQYGGMKYFRGNFRKGAPAAEQVDCTLRHLIPVQQYLDSPDYRDVTLLFDLESWLPHPAHGMFNAAALGNSLRIECGLLDDYEPNPNPPKPGEKPDVAAFLRRMATLYGEQVARQSWAVALLPEGVSVDSVLKGGEDGWVDPPTT